MTARQERFVEEYLVDLNATQAALRAGYTHPEKQGPRLLEFVGVAKAIEARKARRAAKCGITQERVLEEYRTLAMSDITHYQMSEHGELELAPGAPPDAMKAVRSVKKKRREWSDGSGDGHTVEYELEFTLWDKPGSLKIMGKHVDLKGAMDTLKIDFSDAPDAVLDYLAKKGL